MIAYGTTTLHRYKPVRIVISSSSSVNAGNNLSPTAHALEAYIVGAKVWFRLVTALL